jgi:hypothetical protein
MYAVMIAVLFPSLALGVSDACTACMPPAKGYLTVDDLVTVFKAVARTLPPAFTASFGR